MLVVKTKAELRATLADYRRNHPDGRVSFTPTMGSLHAGHLNLARKGRDYGDFSVVSVFVNPLQFNDAADFENYPTDTERDLQLCEQAGVDLVFLPSREEMFPEREPELTLSLPQLTRNLCGRARPGHFEGVLLIVARLFHLVQPDTALFGKKDYQQYAAIRRMAQDLDFSTAIVGCDTVRDSDGLALSSRNVRLSGLAREHALLLHRALKIGEKAFEEGQRMPAELIEIVTDVIESGSQNRVDYVELVDREELQLLDTELVPGRGFLLAVAVFCGGVRLIDNLEIG